MKSSDHQLEIDETLRKVGRNVVHFQRMESMLKFLISRSRLEGVAKDLGFKHQKSVDAVSRQTMGNLVKGFFTSVYSVQGREEVPSAEVTEPWFSVSFNVEADQAYIDQRRAALDQVVEERNVLIHQLLSQFDPTSSESCRELCGLLDEQAEKMRPEYEALRSLVMAVQAGRKEAVEALTREINNSANTNHE